MKKFLSLFLAAVQAWLFMPGLFSPALAASNELTVMIYVCGSDLESEDGQATDDMGEMISAGIGNSAGLTVLAATGGSTQWQEYGISTRSVQYYRVGPSRPELLRDVGRKNMGDPNTLSEFIRFGLSTAPANRYILILWDHGGGPVYGVCNDANFNDDGLTLPELHSGLVSGLGGTRLDIIAFDCCLMNCIDLCADLADVANYSVLSQETVSGTGLDYDGWLSALAVDPTLSSESIAMSIADSYVNDNASGYYASTATMSVIASEKMPAVMDAANAFSAALSEKIRTNLSSVVRLRSSLTSFGEFVDYDATDLVDLFDMCDAFSAILPEESTALRAAAEQAVCYNVTTNDISSYAHGLSFFLPYETVSSAGSEIMSHYGSLNSAYSSLVVSMTSQISSSGYTMSASSYTPSSFYTSSNGSCSGSLCNIWDGYYGNYCSFSDAYNACGGDIWSGLDTGCGSIWDGYNTSSGLWDGYAMWDGYDGGFDDGGWSSGGYYDDGSGLPGGNIWGGYGGSSGNQGTSNSGLWSGSNNSAGNTGGTSTGGIWANNNNSTAGGNTGNSGTAGGNTGNSSTAGGNTGTSASQTNQAAASQALNNIWAGLLNTGSAYYQPGSQNQNIQAGVSTAATPQNVLSAAGNYFSSSQLNSQMIYSLQLTRSDLDNLATASGVLNMQKDGETIRLGNMGITTIDWSTGLIFSMFDGSWPNLNGQMVRAELLYTDEDGNTRFIIPARVNSLKMYLLGTRDAEGSAVILGATQGYDENGFAIRGHIPLEEGMTIAPLFTAVSADGTEHEYEGTAVTVPADGLSISWSMVPAGTYQYCFGLTDLSGRAWYTDSVPLTF